MIKSISYICFIHIFSFFAFFQGNGINVHQVVPVTLAEGESQEVKVIIEKNDITGFAKFEIEVDPGLEISAGKIGSASFTFEEGVAKFIWFALPEEDSFSISYFVTNTDSSVGNMKNISSQFSYLENNAKKVFNCPLNQITIEEYSNDSLVALEDITIGEEIPQMDDNMDMSPEERLASIKNHVVKINREFQRIESGLYRMKINIDKGPIVGFAKLEEVVPDGFEYIEEETNGAIFTKVKGKAKFVWFNVPNQNQLEISYNLKAEEANVVGLHNITGEFTYLIDDQDVKSQSIPAFFQINSDDLETAIQNNSFESEAKEEITDNQVWKTESLNETELADLDSKHNESDQTEIEEALIEQSEQTGISGLTESIENLNDNTAAQSEEQVNNSAKEETDLMANEDQNEELKNDNRMFVDADEGISYRVQICATRKMAEKEYFRRHMNFTQAVTIENHEGWYKYTSGTFNKYQSARNSREGINTSFDFDGPFVTAYNDGERISVQEALMISNQKWFK